MRFKLPRCGTYVGPHVGEERGQRLPPNEPRELKHGDEIIFGVPFDEYEKNDDKSFKLDKSGRKIISET